MACLVAPTLLHETSEVLIPVERNAQKGDLQKKCKIPASDPHCATLSDVLSGILSYTLSDIFSGIFSGILSDIYYDIFFCILLCFFS